MSEPRFIFNTVDYQNSANTFNNYVNTVNATNNAAATGNSFQFRTDADRMKYLTGTKGKPRVSGYYPGLYATIYRLTVVQNGSTLPSINGPGNAGWGQSLWTGPIPDVVNIGDTYLQQRSGNTDYLGVQIAGYIYSDIRTTIVFQTQSDDGTAIYLNGTLVLNAWAYQGTTRTNSASVVLNVGYNPIRILYFEGAGGSVLTFGYSIGGGPMTTNIGCSSVYNYAQM